MLDKEALQNVETIKINAHKVWGDEIVFGEINVLPRPFSEFSWSVRIYGKYDLRIEYDRSILGVRCVEGENVINLFHEAEKALEQKMTHGFKSCVPENMLRNFKLLDEFITSGKLAPNVM